MLDRLLDTIDKHQAARVTRRSRHHAALRDLPDSLLPYWQRSAHHEFPGIPTDAFFFARAAEGLLIFFDCVKYSRKTCVLPSKAADSVWHAWARHAPAGLDAFCIRHFGRAIAHVEAAGMSAHMEQAVLNCLVQARRLEAKAGTAPALPRLFALDRELKMPGGFWYRLSRGQIAFSAMNERGAFGPGMSYPASLGPAQLLAAGLVTRDEYDRYAGKTKRGASGSASSSDADACEGGDGSGCGGGCGGD